MKKIEIRTLSDAPLLRRDEAEGESRTIEGYAIVFNCESEVLCDGGGRFREVIDSGAVTGELITNSDIRCLLEHNPQRLLARCRQGEGSLTLSLDERGLKYSFEAPHTADGDAALELVKRGDIYGSSFAYLANERTVEWTKTPDGTPLRRVKEITYLEDVSLVSRPAYSQTSVSARELTQREESGDRQQRARQDIKAMRKLAAAVFEEL